MKKILKLKPYWSLGILVFVLLIGIVFSVVQIARGNPAAPDPGHSWSDIGNDPGDLIPTNRLGYGTASASTFLSGNQTWTELPTNMTVSVFTSSGTWTKPSGLKFVKVIVTGGGGGGGGSKGDGTSEGGGGGGGAGGTTIKKISAADLSETVNVTVGTGGTGGANTGGNGGDGTNSSFGNYVSANGGKGGTGEAGGGTCATTADLGIGGDGGAASTDGDINLAGGKGLSPVGCVAEYAQGGTGGASYWGAGGAGGVAIAAQVSAGQNGPVYGAGGGGAAEVDSSTGAAGGNGADGVVVIYQYF